jgi:hypothetical protein
MHAAQHHSPAEATQRSPRLGCRLVTAYQMLADGRPNGNASSEERMDDGGTHISFAAELGSPRPDRALVGELFLDSTLAWRTFELEVDGRVRSIAHEPGLELEIEGVPALYGVTVRRLVAGGLVPGGKREIDVLRVGLDDPARHLKVRYTWLGGPRFRYEVPADHEASWLLVRPATGIVVSVEDEAELR